MNTPPKRVDRNRDLQVIREARMRQSGGAPMFDQRRGSPARTVMLAILTLGLLVVAVVVSRIPSAPAPIVAVDTPGPDLTATAAGPTATPLPDIVTLRVSTGATWSDVADELHALGLIDNTFLFRSEVRLLGSGASLEAGSYTLHRGMTYQEIIQTFETPAQAPVVAVRFIEGWRSEQDQAELASQKVAGAPDFQSLVRTPSSQLLNSYPFLADKPVGAPLEGYLFPDTYQVLQDASASDVITKMLDRFGQQVTPNMRQQAQTQGHTLYQVLIVASIVEREAAVPQERSLIAGVYWNRLVRGDCMCADPTVQYALGNAQNWWPVLNAQARTLAPESTFNTYTHLGFPPTPIANPGLASITAALNPQGDFLYFVAKGDGTHLFAHTLQEQTQNQEKVQNQ